MTEMTTTHVRRAARAPHIAPTRRIALGLGGSAMLAALLSSCDSGSSRMPAGVATLVEDGRLEDPAWETMPSRSSHAIELPEVRYLVQELGTTPTLTRNEAVRLFAETPEETGEDGLVHAAEGEVFLLVHLVATPPLFMPLASPDSQERTERILIGDTELETAQDPMSGLTRDGRTLVVSIPEGAGPEHARLEVTGSGGTQVLSLVDGRRLGTPFEHLYEHSFSAAPTPLWWERRDDAVAADRPMIAGTVFGVQVPAVRADGVWPEPGNLLLGVHLSTIASAPGVTETSTLRLILPDGSEASAHDDPAEAFIVPHEGSEEGRELAWFEVPHTAESVTLRLHLTARTGSGDLDLGDEEVPVAIGRRRR